MMPLNYILKNSVYKLCFVDFITIKKKKEKGHVGPGCKRKKTQKHCVCGFICVCEYVCTYM